LPAYLTRGEAVVAYGDGDPAVDEAHVFQGDLFIGLDLFAPGKDGDPWVISHGVVISHHCQWTKARKKLERGEDWPILVAPAHELHSSLGKHDQALAREGRFRYYLALPTEGPVDRELVVDLRLIQPVTASDLARARYWACMGPELLDALRAKVVEFVWSEFSA
jgi:hypothetical protein